MRPEDLIEAFPDLDEMTEDCPRGCTHGADEPECGLDEAVARGEADPERVESFRRLLEARSAPGVLGRSRADESAAPDAAGTGVAGQEHHDQHGDRADHQQDRHGEADRPVDAVARRACARGQRRRAAEEPGRRARVGTRKASSSQRRISPRCSVDALARAADWR